ncbi:MAG: ShlB/FhaC/HecB family hemolysin secretion/activation protein, partial [Opitutaceae bacterium]
ISDGCGLRRYRDLKFVGNKWFSSQLLREKLGVKPGDEVRLSTLQDGVNWTNTNPFRQVQVLVNDKDVEAGKADLIVAVQERMPLRGTLSYNNYGNTVTGDNRYSATIQYGNLWGKDHQASYTYITTDRPKNFQVHSADYRIPLPWHHYLQIAGIFAKFEPDINADLSQKGKTTLANVRYIAPVDIGPISMELSAGLDYKQSNSNLYYNLYNVTTDVFGTKVDVLQANLSATASRPDKLGAWTVGVNLNLSPGRFNTRNSDEQFQASRPGSDTHYVYGTLFVQRLFKLPAGFNSMTNLQYQKASTNLTGSEQMVVGGHNTARGYREAVFAGDEGVVFSQEFSAPPWTKAIPHLPKGTPPLTAVPLVFFDYAHTWYKFRATTDIPMEALASMGIGLRCAVGPYFSLSADFGWQLRKTSAPIQQQDEETKKNTLLFRLQPLGSRGSIRVSMSY